MLGAYVSWHKIFTQNVNKTLRYSIGIRIDSLYAELVEIISSAQFSQADGRLSQVEKAVTKNDTLKFMLLALFELSGVSKKEYLDLSIQLEEVGRMLYGWKNNILKQNRPD